MSIADNAEQSPANDGQQRLPESGADAPADIGGDNPLPVTVSPDDALGMLGDDGRQAMEALLFLADEPLSVDVVADALEHDVAVVAAAIVGLQELFAQQRRGMEIRHAAGGWRMYSATAARPALERWALTGRTGRLTQAALETLAVITYKQPISRQDIGDIRGVSADGAVRSLVARGLVTEVGRDEGPGQAILYGTTPALLERLGLDHLDELPPLTDYLPDAPAPDEPELGALKEIRRRLAAAGGRDDTVAPADDAMPAPTSRQRLGDDNGDIDGLTDRLEVAARNAMGRLRRAVDSERRDAEHDDGRDDDRGDQTSVDEAVGAVDAQPDTADLAHDDQHDEQYDDQEPARG